MPEDINIAHILEYPGVSHGVNWVSHRGTGHYYIEYIVHLSDVVSVLSLWRMRSAADGCRKQEGRTSFTRAGEVACHWWSSPVLSECLSFTNNDSLVLLLCATTSGKSRGLPRTELVLLIRLCRFFLSAVVMPSQPHGESSGGPPTETSVSWHSVQTTGVHLVSGAGLLQLNLKVWQCTWWQWKLFNFVLST